MKQKFFIGDKVFNKSRGPLAYNVKIVTTSDGKIFYAGSFQDVPDEECDLELYEEPKVKKLYAYINEDLVIFSPIEAKAVRVTGVLYDRCENFDITYGEDK